ncbi:MAG: hypothetical protein LBT23_12100 [Synergistaceae bacterium]|jgi:hypothetical protein|nr:hypothetical protein [Synergistaceae bacterium]
MSVQNANQANSLFIDAWNDVSRKVKRVTDSDQNRAREAFYKAVRACDKATESMVDRHLESVAESAKRQAEYRKKKAVADRAAKTADERRVLNADILLERINYQNMLEESRIRELNRKELMKEAVS